MNRITTAPITHAQIAPGPANCAARHAPKSQPEPMIEPRPVNISAHAPTLRRIAFSLLMQKPSPAKTVPDDRRTRRVCPGGEDHVRGTDGDARLPSAKCVQPDSVTRSNRRTLAPSEAGP